MTMQTLADAARVVNVLLAILYLPLIFYRLNDDRADVPIMRGIVLVLLSVILGSWENRHNHLRIATLVMTAALLTLITAAVKRAIRQHRAAATGRTGPTADG